MRPHNLRTHRRSLTLQLGLVISLHVSVSNHRVQVKLRGVLAQQFQMRCRGKADRLPIVGEVHNHATACLRADNRLTLSVQQQMRQNRRTPRTRTQNNPVGFFNSGECLWAGASILRGQTNIVNAFLLREVHLADHLHTLDTATVILTQHGPVNDHRIQRHRQHAAARIQ